MIIDSPIISGSHAASGSLNQTGNVVITGSLTVTGTINASITGSITSASYASYAETLDGLDSTSFTTTSSFNTASGSFSTRVTDLETASGSFSTRVTNNESTGSSLTTASGSFSTRVTNNEATGSSLVTASGSFSTRTTNLETASGSFSTRVTNTEATASSLVTASGSFSTRTTNLETASGSFSTRTTNLETASGSFSTRVTSVEGSVSSLNSKSGSYATTGSNNFNGNQVITGSLTTTGTIVAQTLNVQQVTSSIVYSSGSNIFGNSVSNTQQFTGSLQVSSSTSYILGNVGIGTTNPSQKVTIQGSGGYGLIEFRSGSLGTTTAYFGIPEESGNVFTTSNAGDLCLRTELASSNIIFGYSNAEKVRITSGGIIGIGTTSLGSWAKLQAAGNIAITGGGYYFSNNLVGGSTPAYLEYNYGTYLLTLGSYYGDIQFLANTSERMRITGAGNVGIYLTSPTQRLSIRGNQVFTNQDADGVTNALIAEISSQARGYSNQGSNMASIQFRTNSSAWYMGEIAFLTNNVDGTDPTKAATERMRINKDGNVGVGTASPTNKLEVDGGSSAVALRVSTTNTGAGVATLILANSSKSAFNDGAKISHGAGYTNITDLNNTNIMTWDMSNTRVGIGTTSPGAKLQVYGNLQIYAGSSGNSDPLVFGAETGAPKKAIFLENFWMVYQGHDNEGHKFRSVNAGGSGTDDMVITGGGNVGIGTTSPSARLDLGSSYGASGEKFFIYNDNSASALAGTKVGFYMDRFSLSNNSTFVFPTATSDPGSYIIASKDTSTTTLVDRMTVLGQSGNVGIGTRSPSYKLQVYNSDNGTTAAFGGTTYGVRIDNGGTFSSGRSTIYGVNSTFYGSYQPLAIGASTLYFNISGNDKMIIDSSGNVGIDRMSPLSKLAVYGGPVQIMQDYPGHQIIVRSAGTSGTYNGQLTITIPEMAGAGSSQGYGGYSCEVYVSGYSGIYCHAWFSGYINNGITVGETTIIRSNGGWSISQTAIGTFAQGFQFVLNYPDALIHPTARIIFNKGGDPNIAEYPANSITAVWS